MRWANSSSVSVAIWLALAFLTNCKSTRNLSTSSKDTRDTTSVATVQEVDSTGLALLTPVDSAALDSTLTVVEPVLYYKDTIKIIGVGDIMMSTNFPSQDYLAPDNARDLWREVTDTLKQADITFGNLEGVLLDDGGEQKECRNPKVCYLFRTPVRYASNLVDAGFDVMSLANNHAGDFGDTGRQSTMFILDSLGIQYAGIMEAPYTTFEVEGLTIGFAAFAPNKGTVSIHDPDRMHSIFAHLDSISDLVIASFHAGAEGNDHLHVPRETETYYGENRGNVYELARVMIDAGADVVFGHGPHVPRAIDLYQNRLIVYSLGNFCTYGRFSLRENKALAPVLEVEVDRQGKFLTGKIIPFKLIERGRPIFDNDSKSVDLIRELTQKDFPEIPLMIDESGRITYIEN